MTRRAAAPGRQDPKIFIRDNLRLTPVRAVPEILLYTAHSGSGLGRIGAPGPDGGDAPAPYWAFPWAGGLALARYILDRPATVAGRRVLDLGAGSGLVAIAAAKARAQLVLAAEIAPHGRAAIALNAAANDVAVDILPGDLTAGPPPAVDLILGGDVFYAEDVGARMLPFLDRCLAAGIDVLIGDPGRVHLPTPRLRRIAEYAVGDMGEAGKPSAVYALEA